MEQMNLERRDVITGRDLEEAARAGVKDAESDLLVDPRLHNPVGDFAVGPVAAKRNDRPNAAVDCSPSDSKAVAA